MTLQTMRLVCGQCKTALSISVELIENMIEYRENEKNGDFEDDIDRMIAGSHAPIHMEEVPFPVAIDLEDETLNFLGWCPKCKKVAVVGITPDYLSELIEELKKRRRAKGDGQ